MKAKAKKSQQSVKHTISQFRVASAFLIIIFSLCVFGAALASNIQANQLSAQRTKQEAQHKRKLADIQKVSSKTKASTPTVNSPGATVAQAKPQTAVPAAVTPTVAAKPAAVASTKSTTVAKSAPTTSASAPAAGARTLETGSSVSYINNLRGSLGKSALTQNAIMDQWALIHAQTLAAACTLYHQNMNSFLGKGIGPITVHSIAENVGYANTTPAVLNALKNSPGHYANMTGDYQYVGIGVVTAGPGSCAGYVYTTQLFAK